MSLTKKETTFTYWTTERFKESITEHHIDMKSNGWKKSDAKKDIIQMMKDNDIKIKN